MASASAHFARPSAGGFQPSSRVSATLNRSLKGATLQQTYASIQTGASLQFQPTYATLSQTQEQQKPVEVFDTPIMSMANANNAPAVASTASKAGASVGGGAVSSVQYTKSTSSTARAQKFSNADNYNTSKSEEVVDNKLDPERLAKEGKCIFST